MSNDADTPKPVRRGGLIVISAPSGAGKSTLLARLLSRVENLRYSVSHTTRAPRAGEQHGKDYFFVTVEEFHRMRERGEFLESAHVHGNFYGTNKRYIEGELTAGWDILLDIDVQGAAMINQVMPQAALIFIMPPGYDILSQRLRSRGLDKIEDIEKRLRNATDEVARYREFHFVIINDNLEEAIDALASIVHSERHRWRRLDMLLRNIVNTFEGAPLR